MVGEIFKKRLQILGREFSTKRVSALAELGDKWGDCCPFGQEIRIEDGMVPESETHIVVHEILHGYDDILGIDLEHKQIDSLAYSVIDLIRNNPQLVKYITEKKK